MNHAVAAKGDNGAIALSLCGQLLGVSHALGQHQVKLGCARGHIQKALQALGNFAQLRVIARPAVGVQDRCGIVLD